MMARLSKPVVLPVQPALVVGLGTWGRRVLRSAARALHGAHPAVLETSEWAYLSPEGLRRLPWSEAPTWQPAPLGADPPAHAVPPGWLEGACADATLTLDEILAAASSQEKAGRLRVGGYRTGSGGQTDLTVYLVGRLDEPFAQSVLLDLVRLLRAKRDPAQTIAVTLLLGVDSPRFARLSADEKAGLRGIVGCLGEFLSADAGSPAVNEEGVRWCYIANTRDSHGDTLSRVSPTRTPAAEQPALRTEPEIFLLAEVAGAFVALLMSSELQARPDYAYLSLPELARSAAEPGDALCSAFSCAGRVLPVPEIVGRAAWRLGIGLLRELDPRGAYDIEEVKGLAEQFFVAHRLRHAQVTSHLQQDAAGQRLQLRLDPALLRGVPDDLLVDRILSWGAFVARNKMEPIARGVTARRDALLADSRGWLSAQVDRLVTQSPSGPATARVLCEKLLDEVRSEQQPAPTHPEPRGCLAALLALSPPSRREPVSDAYVEEAQHALQRALGERLERRAVWVRYVYLAIAAAAFTLAAWRHIRAALNISLDGVPVLPPAIVDPWLFPLLILAAGFLAIWSTVARSELRIVHARNRLAGLIARQHAEAVDLMVEDAAAYVYGRLEIALREQLAAVERWRAVTAEAAAGLKRELADDQGYEPACLERTLLERDQYDTLLPERPGREVRELLERWLKSGDVCTWRTAEAGEVRAAVYRFTYAVEGVRADLSVEDYMERAMDQRAAQSLVESLQRETSILLSLDGFPDAAHFHALGTYDREMTGTDRWIVDPPSTRVISTRDPARLVFAPTVHGLRLAGLKIWDKLT